MVEPTYVKRFWVQAWIRQKACNRRPARFSSRPRTGAYHGGEQGGVSSTHAPSCTGRAGSSRHPRCGHVRNAACPGTICRRPVDGISAHTPRAADHQAACSLRQVAAFRHHLASFIHPATTQIFEVASQRGEDLQMPGAHPLANFQNVRLQIVAGSRQIQAGLFVQMEQPKPVRPLATVPHRVQDPANPSPRSLSSPASTTGSRSGL